MDKSVSVVAGSEEGGVNSCNPFLCIVSRLSQYNSFITFLIVYFFLHLPEAGFRFLAGKTLGQIKSSCDPWIIPRLSKI